MESTIAKRVIYKRLGDAVLGIGLLLALSDSLLAFGVSSAGPVSSFLYLAALGIVVVYTCVVWLVFLRYARENHGAWIAVGGFIALVFFVGIATGVSQYLSGETTQEVACGVQALTSVWDGWQRTCFLGYPLRQYVAMAVPTFLFGRSLLFLHVGVAAAFLGGVLVYLSAIVMSKRSQLAVAVGLFAMGVLFHARFVTYALFRFEQSIVPMIAGLYLVGTYLHYRRSHHSVHLSVATLVCVLALSGYTPVLVYLPLVMLCSWSLWMRMERKQRIRLYIALLCIIAASLVSLTYRQDLKLVTGEGLGHWRNDIVQGMQFMFFINGRYPYGSIVLKLSLALAGVYLTLFSSAGRVFVLWAVGVIIASVLSKGYTWYGVDFRLHRTIVLLPVIFGALQWYAPTRVSRRVNMIAVGCAVGVLVSGLWLALSQIRAQPPNVHMPFITALNTMSADRRITTLGVAEKETLQVVSVGDALRYFSPEITMVKEEDFFPDHTCIPQHVDALIIHTKHPCYRQVVSDFTDSSYTDVLLGIQAYRIVFVGK